VPSGLTFVSKLLILDLKMNLQAPDVVKAISQILRSSVSEREAGAYSFIYMDRELPPIASAAIQEAIEVINSFEEVGDTCIISKTSYEALVNIGSPIRRTYGQMDLINIGFPSEYFIIYLWLKLERQANVARSNLLRRPSGSARIERAPESVQTVWDAIRFASSVYSLRIVARRAQPSGNWEDYANAFLFQVSYNLDVSILPDRDLRSISRATVPQGLVRRSGRGDLDVPRRDYVSDLIYHYQLGVFSSGTPMLQYISYYHVAEHWFESVFEEDLIQQVRRRITDPGFSYKRNRDLSKLIKLISKAVRHGEDRLIIDELTALRLTLERYVNLEDLKSELQSFDSTLLGYYASTQVSFCDGDVVNFRGEQSEVMKTLARRIYKTRNALVHSKDGARGKFTPFTDDQYLIPEVPLMRFIAEQIIIATSEIRD
jgi:hypothetical protein